MKRYFACLLLVVLAGCSQSPEQKKESLYQSGLDKIAEYRFDAAQAKFLELSDFDPSSPMGYLGTGMILEKQMCLYDALDIFMTVAEADAGIAPAHAGIWRVMTGLGEHENAMTAAVNWNRASPDDPEATMALARSLLQIDLASQARGKLDLLLDQGGDEVMIEVMRAWSHAVDHDYDTAAAAYDRALTGGGLSAAASRMAVQYLEEIGEVDSAMAMSRQSVRLSGDDRQARIDHFHVALEHRYLSDARRTLAELESGGLPESILAIMNVDYHVAAGTITEARRGMDRVMLLVGSNLSTQILEMDVRGRADDELSVTTNSDVVRRDLESGKRNQSFADFASYMVAIKMTEFFKDFIGLDQLKLVPPAYKSRVSYGVTQAYLLYRTGQHEAFEEEEGKILKYHSGQPAWMIALADRYADVFMRRYDDAARLYAQVLKEDQWNRVALEHWVAMHRRLDQYEKIVDLFERYPSPAELFPEVGLLQAVCLAEGGLTTDGISLFLDRAGSLRGNLSWFEQMHLALEEQDDQAALAKLADWLEENDADLPELLSMAAGIRCDQKNYEAGRITAEQAVSLEAGLLLPLVNKARALYGLGQTEEALEILDGNVRQNEFHVESNLYLSKFLATEGMDPNRAANLARRAVFDSHSGLKPWLNLSYVYFQIGRYDLSRGEATKADRSYGGRPEAKFRIGMALYMEGKAEAREMLEKAIATGLHGDNLAEAQQTLKKLP